MNKKLYSFYIPFSIVGLCAVLNGLHLRRKDEIDWVMISLGMFILLSVFSINLAIGQKSIQINGQTFYQVSTISELKQIGKKYNLEELVSENLNQYLQYETKQDVEKYFKQEYEVRESIKDAHKYLNDTKFVKTPEDWIKLVESMPRVKQTIIESWGGKEKYDSYKQEILFNKQRIYRLPNGSLLFDRYSIKEDKATLPRDVVRIDNLPKN